MEKWQKRALDLVAGLSRQTSKNPSVVPYSPQKTAISGKEEKYFHRTTPEAVGVSSSRILSMLLEIEANPRANIHNILVLRGSEVICEASAPGYSTNTWHLSHSMSKTITGMAIGILIDEGRLHLETPLIEIFPEISYKDKRFPKITVDTLLSMTSGSTFNEVGSVTESAWLEAFFSSPLLFTPGDKFAYNSMNSYVLSRIVERVTGASLEKLVTARIFKPLGIKNYLLEKAPDGSVKGGWGMYLSPESWAKLGFMMLRRGKFEKREILDREWVRDMTIAHGSPHESSGDFNYGYHLWVSKKNTEFLFNGMLGQNVWVCPKNDLVVVVNSGNNELFQQSPSMSIIRKYLGGNIDEHPAPHRAQRALREHEREFFASRGFARLKRERRGLSVLLGFKPKRSFDVSWEKIIGKRYGFRKNHVGILPLFVRAMQNNLDASLEYMEFLREGDSVFLAFGESGVDYKLEVGIYEPKYTVLEWRGEKYMVGLAGEAMRGVDKNPLYKLEFIFPELPNTRKIKVSFVDRERILVRFFEMPDNKIVASLFESFPVTNPKVTLAIKLLEDRLGGDFISSRLESVFTPSFVLADMASTHYEDIIAEENSRAEETMRTMKTIHTIITKLTREFDEDTAAPDEETAKPRSIISNIVDKIKSRFGTPDKSDMAKEVEAVLDEAIEEAEAEAHAREENLPDTKYENGDVAVSTESAAPIGDNAAVNTEDTDDTDKASASNE